MVDGAEGAVSNLVLGVLLYRHIPPPSVDDGVTATDLADAVGITVRSVQRHLVTFERAGMVQRRAGAEKQIATRWWRA